jgi:DNA-binding GntR family transcriptional regulator
MTMRGSAYDVILRAIDLGEIPPGARLIESELAERFGCSRTPVREALRRLEAQGLILHEPYRGMSVAVLDYRQITELYTFREIFEGAAARLAAISATDAEIELLGEMVREDALLVDDPKRLADRNKAFHRQIHLCAHNRYLNDALERLRVGLALLSGTTLSDPARARQSLKEHEVIVATIAARNADLAEDAARAHIKSAYRCRLRQNAVSPDHE